MRILLIDENPETYEVLNEVAKLSQSEIIYFDDIMKAEDFLDESEVVDIDGIITEKYTQNKPIAVILNAVKEKNVDIPIILLTTKITEEEEEYFKKMGVSSIMLKPFNPLEVLTEIVEILKKEKGEEYVKERLHTTEADRSSLKRIIEKIINLFKKLLGK